jgi:uncharacterized protein (DUF1501 family)
LLGSPVAKGSTNSGKTLVVMFLRGGADGLSLVPPAATKWAQDYFSARPNIQVPLATTTGLTGGDGWRLHPKFDALQQLWNGNELAIIMGTGSPNVTRSHFEQQDLIEKGLIHNSANGGLGYLARAMPWTPGLSSLGGISVGDRLALSLSGHNGSIALDLKPENLNAINDLRGRGWNIPTGLSERLKRGWILQRAENAPRLAATQATNAIDLIASSQPDAGLSTEVDYKIPQVRNAVGMMLRLPNMKYVTVDIEGWDTHINMGSPDTGTFSGLVHKLDSAIRHMRKDLEAAGRWQDTCVVVMTEFGRPLKENGNRGLDHGRGGAAFVIGSGVGRGVFTAPTFSLKSADLEDDRDIKVTIDYREYISRILQNHMGVSENDLLSKVFPGFTPSTSLDMPLFV